MTVRPRSRGPAEGLGGDEAAPPTSQVIRVVEPFERFYGREFRSVVGLAYALSGSRAASEDLAQEAFIAAHRNWDKVGHMRSRRHGFVVLSPTSPYPGSENGQRR